MVYTENKSWWDEQMMWLTDLNLQAGVVAPAKGKLHWWPEPSVLPNTPEITFTIETENPDITVDCGIYIDGWQSLRSKLKNPLPEGTKVDSGDTIAAFKESSLTFGKALIAYFAVCGAPGQILIHKTFGPVNMKPYRKAQTQRVPIGSFVANVYKSEDERLLQISQASQKLLANAFVQPPSAEESERTARPLDYRLSDAEFNRIKADK